MDPRAALLHWSNCWEPEGGGVWLGRCGLDGDPRWGLSRGRGGSCFCNPPEPCKYRYIDDCRIQSRISEHARGPPRPGLLLYRVWQRACMGVRGDVPVQNTPSVPSNLIPLSSPRGGGSQRLRHLPQQLQLYRLHSIMTMSCYYGGRSIGREPGNLHSTGNERA